MNDFAPTGDFGENPSGDIVGGLTGMLSGLSAFSDSPPGEDSPDSRMFSEPPYSPVRGSGSNSPNGFGTTSTPPGGYVDNNGVMGEWVHNANTPNGFSFVPTAQQSGFVKMGDKTGKGLYVPSTQSKIDQYGAIARQGELEASGAFWNSMGESLGNTLNVGTAVGKSILLVGALIAATIIFTKVKG